MREIRINRIEGEGVQVFAVKVGCQNFSVLGQAALMDQLDTYLSLEGEKMRLVDKLMSEANQYYSNMKMADQAPPPAGGWTTGVPIGAQRLDGLVEPASERPAPVMDEVRDVGGNTAR